MTDREWQLRAALSALLAEINTRCVKSNPAVRLVAIDEELILTAEAVLGGGVMNIEELVKKHFDRWVTDTEFGNVEVHLRAAITEQAETHALELRAYEATVANLEERIRQLESQRVPEGLKLVPEIATDRMVSVGMDEDHRLDACDAAILWTVMLAAAPQQKKEPRHD